MTENKTTKKKKRNKNYYFTKIHEEAVVKYASTDDLKIRTDLYIELSVKFGLQQFLTNTIPIKGQKHFRISASSLKTGLFIE